MPVSQKFHRLVKLTGGKQLVTRNLKSPVELAVHSPVLIVSAYLRLLHSYSFDRLANLARLLRGYAPTRVAQSCLDSL